MDHCDTGSNSRPSHRLRPGGGGPGRCHAPNQSHQRRVTQIPTSKISQFGGYQYYQWSRLAYGGRKTLKKYHHTVRNIYFWVRKTNFDFLRKIEFSDENGTFFAVWQMCSSISVHFHSIITNTIIAWKTWSSMLPINLKKLRLLWITWNQQPLFWSLTLRQQKKQNFLLRFVLTYFL